MFSRVDATHFSFSDSNSPLQGIPKYKIRMPCKVLGQSDQFVLGPHPPLGKGGGGVFKLFLTLTGQPYIFLKKKNIGRLDFFLKVPNDP